MILNLKEACEFLKVSKSTIRRWEKNGQIKSVRTVGNHRRYELDELKKALGLL